MEQGLDLHGRERWGVYQSPLVLQPGQGEIQSTAAGLLGGFSLCFLYMTIR